MKPSSARRLRRIPAIQWRTTITSRRGYWHASSAHGRGVKAARPSSVMAAACLRPVPRDRGRGLEEAPQSGFEAPDYSKLDPALKARLGLDKPTRVKPKAQPIVSANATMESLTELLERGDPNLRDSKPWVPHRPARPEAREKPFPPRARRRPGVGRGRKRQGAVGVLIPTSVGFRAWPACRGPAGRGDTPHAQRRRSGNHVL